MPFSTASISFWAFSFVVTKPHFWQAHSELFSNSRNFFLGKMFPWHFGHRKLLRFEPSSLGSSHLEQQQVKNLLDCNFPNLAWVPESLQKKNHNCFIASGLYYPLSKVSLTYDSSIIILLVRRKFKNIIFCNCNNAEFAVIWNHSKNTSYLNTGKTFQNNRLE